ncbi:hypothetical protein [uncultured Chitinophaga sp.]|jgi:hypothetical protein|uniref:hypothetical protein n=1 Tax=uncultured Chitinophaga sp. TaxID=339340 RepID=UPI0026296C41|nr:hypothetical protein [uncultured Chitinophaga sp.]
MKTFLFLPVLLMAVLFTGCTKKYEYVTPNQTIFFDVAATDWELIPNQSWVVTLPIPEIDGRVNQDFGIVVSISGDNGGTYEALPEVYAGFSYSYTHTQGSLSIERQLPNGTPGGAPEGAVRVKIVLVESQQ